MRLPRLPRKPKVILRERPPEVVAPPGQYLTDKFPVLTYGPTPRIDLKSWRFRIFGLVEQEVALTWTQFTALPARAITADFHCVTQWSRLNNAWEGVAFTELLKLVGRRPEALFVMVHCYGGYTTNLPLATLTDDTVLFAYKHDGKPLPPEHGGPLRLVVPKRYGWKSAKWVNGLEFMGHNEAGFWEQRGYHMEGDPWQEERYSSDMLR
ncbi:MAG: sulfite oxidase-like oxidoreductase [Chloroflexi bacterium]|nr:sulfite oxidase-like oxidoreductase [Chloroflexota bacterium]